MNKITELLNIEYPIISAAMNWVTSAEFVAAVCNAGGWGYSDQMLDKNYILLI